MFFMNRTLPINIKFNKFYKMTLFANEKVLVRFQEHIHIILMYVMFGLFKEI